MVLLKLRCMAALLGQQQGQLGLPRKERSLWAGQDGLKWGSTVLSHRLGIQSDNETLLKSHSCSPWLLSTTKALGAAPCGLPGADREVLAGVDCQLSHPSARLLCA